jgi:repressor LexA
MLTQKQRELLLFIHESISTNGITPSFEEMKDALNLHSKSGIHRLITALVERGYIERLPNRARAIEIRRLPEGYTNTSNNNTPTPSQEQPSSSDHHSIPLMGKIAAGTPIEAIRDESSFVDVPPFLIGRGEHYALTIDGDSMIKAGINDMDTVIIKRCDNVENGAIAVALVDDSEVTLKRIYKENDKIVLQPENDTHESRTLESNRVKIQGRLAGLMRSY